MPTRARFLGFGGNTNDATKRGDPFINNRSFESQWRRSLAGSGIQVDKRTLADSYGLSAAAFACINYNANAVMSVPWKIELPDGSEAPIHPFEGLIADKLFSWNLEAGENIWAIGYARKDFSRHGIPSKIEWLNPQDVQPWYETSGDRTKVAYYMVGTERKKTFPQEMIVFPRFSAQSTGSTIAFSDQTGLSPLEVALTPVTTDRALVNFAASFFLNNAKPEGILVDPKASTDQINQDLKTMGSIFRGAINRWKVHLTNREWQWIPITTNNKDLAMAELDTVTTAKICAAFGVNPILVGLGSASDPLGASSTYNSIAVNHMTNLIIPRIEFYAKVLNDEWASVDFERQYKIVPDLAAVPLLTPITSERVNTILPLITTGTVSKKQSLDYFDLELDENDLQADPTQPLAVWQAEGIRLNRFLELIGEKPDLIDGQNYHYQQAPEIPAFGPAFPGAPSPVAPGLPAAAIEGELPPENIESIKGLSGIQFINLKDTLREVGQGIFPADVAILLSGTLGVKKESLQEMVAKSVNAPEFALDDLSPDEPQPDALSAPPPTRAAAKVPVSFQVGFANNSFITTWQRMTSDTWSGTGITWVHPADYHLSLVYDMDGIPLSAVKELSGAEISQPKMTIDIRSFEVFDTPDDGTALVAIVEPSDQLRAMQSALVIDFMAAGGVPNEFTMPGEWKPHITLAYGGPPDVPPMTMPTALVVNNVQLETATGKDGDYRLMRQWDLAGATEQQRKELKNWERRATKKGADVAFEPKHLRDHPALQFICGELSKEGADVVSIFDAGRALIEGKD